MFDLVQITEDFVDAAMPYFAAQAYEAASHGSVRPDRDPIMQHRRPEDLKQNVIDVVDSQKEWTTKTLALKLGMTWNQSLATSLALIFHELGWKSKKRTHARVVHFSRP